MPLAPLHTASDVLRRMLVDLGVGSLPTDGGDWPIYEGNEPDLPDSALFVSTTQGTPQGRSMLDGEVLGPRGFQVKVRSPDSPSGVAKAEAIRRVLAEDVYDEDVVVGAMTYRVQSVVRIGDVIPLGKEVGKTKRHLFAINAQAHVERTA